MFENKSALIVLFLSFFVFSACTKVSDKTNIYVKSMQVLEKDALEVKNVNTVGYIFVADTTFYAVNTYAQAFGGEIVSKESGEKLQSLMKGAYNSETNMLEFVEIGDRNLLTVVCDTVTKVFYYRNIETKEGLENLYVTLKMRQYPFVDKKAGDTTVIDRPWIGKK